MSFRAYTNNTKEAVRTANAKLADFMDYEELKRELSDRSITQLPGLLLHITRLCAIKPVFKDKEAMLRFVNKAWDMGEVGQAELRKDSQS